MRHPSAKQPNVLRWLASLHSIHAVLIAVASLGAVLPTVRMAPTPTVVHADSQHTETCDTDEDDRDRSQNQDRDSDQDQDRDVSDLNKLFMASETDDFLAPELISILRRGAASVARRDAAGLLVGRPHAQSTTTSQAPRPVYTRTCRLML